MKRLLCVVLVMAMFMCTGVSVMAEGLDFLTKEYKSVSADMEISFELNKPIELLEYVNEDGFGEYGDIKELVSSLFESVITMNVTSLISDDCKSMKASAKINSDIPFKLNDDFGGNVYFNVSSWIDVDLNDDAEKYLTITKTPFYDKYMVADLFEAANLDKEEVINILKTAVNPDIIKEIQLEAIKVIEKNAEVDINKNEITVVFDDTGAKNYLFDVIELVLSLEEHKNIFGDLTGMNTDIFQVLGMGKAFVQDIKIFDSIVLNYVVDDGFISEQNAEINFDINVYDIMSVFGENDEYITKENGDICFTVNLKCEYYDVNKVKEVKLPEINDENSVDLNRENEYEYLPEVNEEEYVSPYIFFETMDYPVIKDNIYYFPFRAAVNAIDEDSEIMVSEGVISAAVNDKIIMIKENTNRLLYNSETYELNNKLYEKNGTLYVTDEFMFKVLGYKLTDVYTGIYDEIYTSYTFESVIE